LKMWPPILTVAWYANSFSPSSTPINLTHLKSACALTSGGSPPFADAGQFLEHNVYS
jgi:hypothetical protein